jgi:ABC-type amino acid transport substrate-binding protein
MISKIVDNYANMALGALSANPDREKLVDFTIPYYYSDITFFTRLTKLSSINAKSLLIEPFSKTVWLYLISFVILSSFVLKFFNQNFDKTFWIIIRALLQKGIRK